MKVRRGRHEEDGTENVMTERPCHAGFVLRAPYLPNQFPSFLYFRRHGWEGPGKGGSDKMGLEGKGTGLS